MRTLTLASTIAVLGLASTANAHFVLMSPPPTNPADTTQGKGGLPCGPDMAMAAMPTMAQGGHAIMLMLKETVPHDGFYRVALSINSRTEIPVDNVVYDNSKPPKVLSPNGPAGTSNSADFENPAVFPVLADNLFPHTGTGVMTFMSNIMLPNVNCDHCTMQVIEFMHPHGYNGTPGQNDGGGYFYHHCADLKITADPALPLFSPGTDGGTTDAKSPSDGAGGTSGAGTAGTSGTTGTAGASGTTGAGGSSVTGTGGSEPTGGGAGSVSTTGTGGSTGSGGDTTGTAGGGNATGAGGSTTTKSSGGGCSLAGSEVTRTASPCVIFGIGLLVARRRRHRS